jgi:hypothetical protein
MRAVLLAVPLVVLSLPAGGQDLKRFEVSAFGGYLYGGTVSDNRFPDAMSPTGELIQNREHVQFDNAPTYGIRFDYRLSGWLLLEAQASTASNSLVFSPLSSGPPNGLDFRTYYYLGYVMLEWPGRQIRPFAVIGVGAAHFEHQKDPQNQFDETRFTGSLGLGMKAFLNEHWGLRIDARGYATRVNGNGGFGIYCTTFQPDVPPGGNVAPVPCERRDWLTNGELSGGIIFAF